MYTVILYRGGTEIKRSQPLTDRPNETFIEHSYFLWQADRHEIIEESGENDRTPRSYAKTSSNDE